MTWTIWEALGLGFFGTELVLALCVGLLASYGKKTVADVMLGAMCLIAAMIPVLVAVDFYSLPK